MSKTYRNVSYNKNNGGTLLPGAGRAGIHKGTKRKAKVNDRVSWKKEIS